MHTLFNSNCRKIIHLDMDCFYAAIEIRDNPKLVNKPVAVGGHPKQRGVVCTCNYLARKYGIHSAMPTATAYLHCKDLIVLPVNMAKYKAVATKIHAIFREFTNLVEPLALDEAYLDVTNCLNYQGSATLIAKAIQKRIWQQEQLTASAGVAPNKFLAKIASGWKKPNGLFVITPNNIANFMHNLPVNKLFGVGKVTANKLYKLGLHTCNDVQQLSLIELVNHFGKFGNQLYYQSRGIDNRPVEPNRIRKSLSVEHTCAQDISDKNAAIKIIHTLYHQLIKRFLEIAPQTTIKSLFVKIKFSTFKQVTAEIAHNTTNLNQYLVLFDQLYNKEKHAIRLLGLGIRFQDNIVRNGMQQSLF